MKRRGGERGWGEWGRDSVGKAGERKDMASKDWATSNRGEAE